MNAEAALSAPKVDAPARRARILSALEVLRALGDAPGTLDSVAAAAVRIGDDGTAVGALEAAIRRLEAGRPPASLEGRFRRDLVSPEAFVAYARLVAGGQPTAAQMDRVEFVLTRLCTRELPSGMLEVLPEDDFVRVLAQVVPGRASSDERRARAVGFFTDAAERLRGLHGVQDLFESGLVVDLRAYRESLNEDRLDPAVLYASVLFEVGLTNHLVRIAGPRSPPEADPGGEPLTQTKTPAPEDTDAGPPGGERQADPAPASREASVRLLVQGATSALEVYRALGARDERIAGLAADADALAAKLARGVDREVERRARALSDDVLDVDDGLEPLWLESALTAESASQEARVRYAAFLTQHRGGAARRRRAEHVVTTLLTRRAKTGELEVLPEAECVRVLARVSPRPLADEAHRSAAATCFLDAARQLTTQQRFEELFDSGLYLNLLGYRSALGWAALDPALLYAQTLLQAALTNHLLRALKGQQITMDRIRTRAAEEERKVAEIFQEGERLEENAELTFDQLLDATIQRLKGLDGSVDLGGGMRTHSGEEARLLRKRAWRTAAAAAALVLATIPLGMMLTRDENQLSSMSDARVQHLAPWLQEGSLSRGAGPKVFLGKVDDATWRVMTPKERERGAKLLAERLTTVDVQSALVQQGDRLAVQIDGGRVVFVR